MNDSNQFTYRYAIRRPDGQLIRKPKTADIFGSIFGKPSIVDDAELPAVRTWDTRAEAEMSLQNLREKAAEIGVGDWLGVIVQQLCTPFTLHDPAEHFAAEVQEWLDGGGA